MLRMIVSVILFTLLHCQLILMPKVGLKQFKKTMNFAFVFGQDTLPFPIAIPERGNWKASILIWRMNLQNI